MWVARVLKRSDGYMRRRTCLSLQGRELQEAAPVPNRNGWHSPCCWLQYSIYSLGPNTYPLSRRIEPRAT